MFNIKRPFTITLFCLFIVYATLSQDFWGEIEFPYGTCINDVTVDNQFQILNGVYITSNTCNDWNYLGLNKMIHDIENDNSIIYDTASQSLWTSGLWKSEDSDYVWDSIITEI
jgi:hypothetical protein